MDIKDFPNIFRAKQHSLEIFNQVKGILSTNKSSLHEYICVYLVGSYGRFEADSKSSDIEWLVVYDEERVSLQEANIFQANLTESFANLVGREKLSIGKTFGEVISVLDLITNIGGIADTSRTLTYRMLCIAEGVPLIKNKTYHKITIDLAKVYGGSHTAGHRMLSFATDISRYWRTLRIDYKQKVDELNKPWAVRGLKLRGCRRYWYCSLILYFITYGPRINDQENKLESFDTNKVRDFISNLNDNPTTRIFNVSSKLNMKNSAFNVLVQIYDSYFGIISDLEVRNELNNLKFDDRYKSENYVKLKDYCIDLHSCMSDLILDLPEFHRKQAIEMFLL